MACQLLARGHCAVPAMHTNSLTNPHGLPLLKNVSFTFLLSSRLSNPISPHYVLAWLSPLLFFSHVSLSFYFFPCFIKETHMVKANIERNYFHLWNPTRKAVEYDFILCSFSLVLFPFSYINRSLPFLVSHTRTHTHKRAQFPQPSYMNDLGACTLTICHLPWALLRPT